MIPACMMLTTFNRMNLKRMRCYVWEETLQSLGQTNQKLIFCCMIFRVGELDENKIQGKLIITGAQLETGKLIREGNLRVAGAQIQHSKMVIRIGTTLEQILQDRKVLPLQKHLAMVDGTGRLVILVEVVVEEQSGTQRDHDMEVVTAGGKPREQIPQMHRTLPFQDRLTLVDGTRILVILVQVVVEEQHGNQMDHVVEVATVRKGKARRTAVLDKEFVLILLWWSSRYTLKSIPS